MSLREAREIFERDYLVLQINRSVGNIKQRHLSKWKEAHYIENLNPRHNYGTKCLIYGGNI